LFLLSLFFFEDVHGGRERAEVKTVNGQKVFRPAIQGKALSTAPVTSARERLPQYNTNLITQNA